MGTGVWMLLPLSLLFFLSQFYRATFAVIASELIRDLSLTAEDLGFLSSVFFYAFAIIQIPMGASIDIFGAKRLSNLRRGCSMCLSIMMSCGAGCWHHYVPAVVDEDHQQGNVRDKLPGVPEPEKGKI